MQHSGVHVSDTQSTGGFSVIEVMMATTILLVGFIGLIQAVTIGSEFLDTARKQQIAAQLVGAEIEKLRGASWSVVAGLPSSAAIAISASGMVSGDTTCFALTNHTTDTSDDNAELCALASGFTCSFARTFLRPSAASATTVTFVKVIYTVTWTTNTGRVKTHQVDAYLARNGLHLSYQQS